MWFRDDSVENDFWILSKVRNIPQFSIKTWPLICQSPTTKHFWKGLSVLEFCVRVRWSWEKDLPWRRCSLSASAGWCLEIHVLLSDIYAAPHFAVQNSLVCSQINSSTMSWVLKKKKWQMILCMAPWKTQRGKIKLNACGIILTGGQRAPFLAKISTLEQKYNPSLWDGLETPLLFCHWAKFS